MKYTTELVAGCSYSKAGSLWGCAFGIAVIPRRAALRTVPSASLK